MTTIGEFAMKVVELNEMRQVIKFLLIINVVYETEERFKSSGWKT